MGLRLNKLLKILKAAGYSIEEQPGGKHWCLRFSDGSTFPIPRHKKNPEILDPILRKLARKLGVELRDLKAGDLPTQLLHEHPLENSRDPKPTS